MSRFSSADHILLLSNCVIIDMHLLRMLCVLLSELHTPRSMASSVCFKNELYVLGGYDGAMDLNSAEKLETRVRICVIINSCVCLCVRVGVGACVCERE